MLIKFNVNKRKNMKKFLLSCVALLVATFASAQSTSSMEVKDAKADGTTSTFTIALDNQGEFTSFQVDFKTTEGISVTNILATDSAKLLNDDEKNVYVVAKDRNKYVTMYAASPSDRRVIPSGDVYKFTVTLASESVQGSITLTPMGFDIKGTGDYDMTPITLDLAYGSITGISNANANADEASVKAQKFMTKKGLVIAKGNKKYNAAAQEVK